MVVDPYYLGKLGHSYTVRTKKTSIQGSTGFFLHDHLPNSSDQGKTVPINEDFYSMVKKGHHKGGNKNSQDANRQGNTESLMEEDIYEYVVPVTSNRSRDCRANFILINSLHLFGPVLFHADQPIDNQCCGWTWTSCFYYNCKMISAINIRKLKRNVLLLTGPEKQGHT